MRLTILVLSLLSLSGCAASVDTVTGPAYVEHGATYRTKTTTIIVKHDPVCVGSCQAE